jgi:hypothetical protein
MLGENGIFLGEKSALNHCKMAHFKTKRGSGAHRRNMLEYNRLQKVVSARRSEEEAGLGCGLL